MYIFVKIVRMKITAVTGFASSDLLFLLFLLQLLLFIFFLHAFRTFLIFPLTKTLLIFFLYSYFFFYYFISLCIIFLNFFIYKISTAMCGFIFYIFFREHHQTVVANHSQNFPSGCVQLIQECYDKKNYPNHIHMHYFNF